MNRRLPLRTARVERRMHRCWRRRVGTRGNKLVEVAKFEILLEIATADSLENEVWDFQVEEFGELMRRDESRFEGVKLGLEQLS